MIEAKKMIKNGQEQAVASWINYLNQVRLARIVSIGLCPHNPNPQPKGVWTNSGELP